MLYRDDSLFNLVLINGVLAEEKKRTNRYDIFSSTLWLKIVPPTYTFFPKGTKGEATYEPRKTLMPICTNSSIRKSKA